MIKIDKDTSFKVLKPEEFSLDNGVCGYGLWKNTVLPNRTLVHSRGFGKGFLGGSWSSVWVGFDTVSQELKVSCNSCEGMTWLFFDESDIKDIEDEDDLECAKYTVDFIKTLAYNGVIELADNDTETQIHDNNLEEEVNMQETNFESIIQEMTELYYRKNNDYGDSFGKSLDEDGLLVSKIRMGDKYNRFSQLIKQEAEVKDESIEDTLIDLANYSVMTLMWIRNQKTTDTKKLYTDE